MMLSLEVRRVEVYDGDNLCPLTIAVVCVIFRMDLKY